MKRRCLPLAALILANCSRSEIRELAPPVRLVDVFPAATVSGSPGVPAAAEAGVDWRYTPLSHGVSDVVADGDRIRGRTTLDLPILRLERTDDADDEDVLHHAEVSLRSSKGSTLMMRFSDAEAFELGALSIRTLWPLRTPLIPGDAVQNYVLTPSQTIHKSDIRYIFLSPADEADASFEIESVRLVFRKEYLAGIPSGVSWQGIGEVFRETIVTRSPETVSFDVDIPDQPRLELAFATIEDEPLTFRVRIERQGSGSETPAVDFARTLTTPSRWEEVAIPLDSLAGRKATVSFSSSSPTDGAIGLWGSPVIRATTSEAPAVILFVADTLRRDRLSTYGHDRDTTPVLTRLAREGALFLDNQSQATWTKVSMPSMLTSLYPSTHGVVDFPDRIPAAATTIAEAYRAAGYATLALSANGFVGRRTNLHQGFEVFQEEGAVAESETTTRKYLDHLLPWIEAHRDVPFFVLFHVTDPHWPYPAYAPYDTTWAQPGERERHEARVEKVRSHIQWPVARSRGLPSASELVEAGVDAETFVTPELDWYDGSIRAMDVEIGRLVETLRNTGLDDRTVMAFTSDHGEEFLEHGNHWHGLNAYGENSNVPLVLWGPGIVPAGVEVSETVQNLDIMPTLLELSAIDAPENVQGQSLVPLLERTESRPWRPRPAVVERVQVNDAVTASRESYSFIADGFRLVEQIGADGTSRYELYDHVNDPLNAEDLASSRPEQVERLSEQLRDWKAWASAARLATDDEASSSMSAEELERLRSLGYVQ